MLVINNIQKLKNQTIGAWLVKGVEIDSPKTSKISDNNYTIRLSRNGGKGAAIIIEREEGEFGYNVSICYKEWDNIISVNAVGKNELKNKDIFLSLMRGVIDAEYDKKSV